MVQVTRTGIMKILTGCLMAVIATVVQLWAGQTGAETQPEETLLMFVGEDTKVLGIASRREQSAWQAPAIARVITQEELRQQGTHTLSRALERIPGFHMAEKEGGSQPYLRGIPDSVLFLYDTVPSGSSVTKSIRQLDHDLTLWSVKRIEIINGPGSVLWGPDAFAGIVNIVPMTGKDLNGVETGVLYAVPGEQSGFYVNAGHDGGHWDSFFSISARRGEEDDRGYEIGRFWHGGGTPVSPEERIDPGTPGESEYMEVYGHLAVQDWLKLSGRMAYSDTPYTMTGADGEISWQEGHSAHLGFLKLEAKRELDAVSALKCTAYHSELSYDHQVIDRTQTQKESSTYAEIVYDRSLMTGTGIFTGGVSYMDKRVEDAPIWHGYLPGFLESDNPLKTPILEEASYDSEMWSLFGQFMKTIAEVDLFAGLRHDRHTDLENQTSLSAGIGWSPAKYWRYKLLYGTAYRTPFASQLYTDEQPEFEQIQSLNLQIAWNRAKQMGWSATGFYQQIDNHVMEDPYAGVSQPNVQDIYGIELDAHWQPVKSLRLQAGLTLVANSGPQENYRYVESYGFDNDTGELVPNYAVNRFDYDLGPDRLFNVQATWQPLTDLSVNVSARYTGSRSLLFPRDDTLERVSVDGAWCVDAAVVVENVISRGIDLEVSLHNLFDNRYDTPGTYDLIEADPFTAQAVLRMAW